jgi:hypothetical protein
MDRLTVQVSFSDSEVNETGGTLMKVGTTLSDLARGTPKVLEMPRTAGDVRSAVPSQFP